MRVRRGDGLRISISEPADERHKPSVDVLFKSIAALKLKKIAAGILTGMGSDGARGLLSLKTIGAKTFAQDEASSVVYGMPREAAKLGAADQVVPLSEIADLLHFYCKEETL